VDGRRLARHSAVLPSLRATSSMASRCPVCGPSPTELGRHDASAHAAVTVPAHVRKSLAENPASKRRASTRSRRTSRRRAPVPRRRDTEQRVSRQVVAHADPPREGDVRQLNLLDDAALARKWNDTRRPWIRDMAIGAAWSARTIDCPRAYLRSDTNQGALASNCTTVASTHGRLSGVERKSVATRPRISGSARANAIMW